MFERIANFFRGIFARHKAAETWNPKRSRLRTALQSARLDWNSGDRQTVQAKARYFEENTAIVPRMATVFGTYTVGNGLLVTPASSNPAWNAAAKTAWDMWTKMPDLNTRQSFACIQGLLAHRWFIDGEIFVLKTYSPDSGRPRIEIIEAHRIKTPPDKQTDMGIVDGIAIDASGRPTGYYVCREDEKGREQFGLPKPSQFTEHVFEPSRAGQYRGIPMFASVMAEIHDLCDLRDLEMYAAKEEAKVVNIVKNAAGELDMSAMRRNAITESRTLSTGTSVSETRSEYITDTIGGETVAMKIGEDLVRKAAVRPSQGSMDYWRELKQEICTGSDVPFVLCYPESIQGTTLRGVLDTAASTFAIRSAVIADVTRRIYEYVMEWEIRNAPAGSALRNAPRDWRNVHVSTPRAPNVDIGRNMKASIDALKAGLTNFDLEYAPLGLDWSVELPKLNEQLQRIKDTMPALNEFLMAQNKSQPDPMNHEDTANV